MCQNKRHLKGEPDSYEIYLQASDAEKVFLNVTACLTALVVTGSIIANECEVQLNSFLGTSSTKSLPISRKA